MTRPNQLKHPEITWNPKVVPLLWIHLVISQYVLPHLDNSCYCVREINDPLGNHETNTHQKMSRENNFVDSSSKWETGRWRLSVLLLVTKQTFLSHPWPEGRFEKVWWAEVSSTAPPEKTCSPACNANATSAPWWGRQKFSDHHHHSTSAYSPINYDPHAHQRRTLVKHTPSDIQCQI